MKKLVEILFSIIFIIILAMPMLIISILILIDSKGPIIHWSERIGVNNKIFLMPKFRTMHFDTPQIATHLITTNKINVTKIGYYLRKFSLDEFPQLYSIINNDMSFVGPRPALFNQEDLIKLRTKNHVHKIKPGITGWAQVNGRDEISILKKVELDTFYLTNRNLFLDIKIIFLTIFKVISSHNISH